MQITESDWKISDWQEACMERLAKEYIILLQSEKKTSGNFWELERRIKQDKKSLGVIIKMRLSKVECFLNLENN